MRSSPNDRSNRNSNSRVMDANDPSSQENTPDIIIATPGRIYDHIENTNGFKKILNGCNVLILDEADRMLGM